MTWLKKGQQNPSTIECKVVRMPKFYALEWQVLEPHYKRWKEGQTAPIDGTPLAAWPGATPQLVKALEPFNIRSLEDLTRMEDASVSRIAIPGLRGKIQHAKAFLEAQATTSGVSAEVAKLREENAWLRDEIAAIKAAFNVQPAGGEGTGEVSPAPRKPGWPLGKPRKPQLDAPT